jgi:hypothetical protein
MTILQFSESNKRLVRKPLPIPKNEHGILHELISLMQQPLISSWATSPLRLDQDASKICAIIPPSWGQYNRNN